ncbi:MAG TPA: GntR family transcriptional regulator [Anaerolineaceae bacterium]|nr:GntR family transcriptional regulator [Anaerolineaceae bacterium]
MKSLRLDTSEDKGLSHWVTVSLQEAILNGQFEPGEKLDQDLIAAQLQVSRTPVREALKVLASEGYVEILPYRGAFIPRVSQRDIYDVYEIRWLIEPEVVRQATPLIPDALILQFEETFEQQTAASGKWSERQVLDTDQSFHALFTRHCQNQLIHEFLNKLNHRIFRVRNFAFRQPGTHLEVSLHEHCAILEAVRQRDPDRAAELMQTHLKNSAHRICQYLNE